MFVISLFAKLLGYDCPTTISNNGHCHDLGRGAWQGMPFVEQHGDYWDGKNTHRPLIFTHCTDLARIKRTIPRAKIVLIDYGPEYYWQISLFRTVKALGQIWNETEYDNTAGPNWPPYSPNNIAESPIIRTELTGFRMPDTQNWIHNIDRSAVDHSIDFATVISGNVAGAVADILNVPVDPAVQQFADQYQTINQEYYQSLHDTSV
jgi:hypothetical protein